MPRTLHARLTLVLLAVLLGLGAATVAITVSTSHRYAREVQQRLNRDLAGNLISDHFILEEGRVRQEALEEIFHDLMVVNPDIEVYLLDPEGNILTFSAPHGKVKRRRVSLGPIASLQEGARLPLEGDDPRDPLGREIFSAAPIREEGRLVGYLYIVLAGEAQTSVAQMLQGSYILRAGAWMMGGSLLVALLGGVLVFSRLTRPIRSLTREMAAFEQEYPESPVEEPAAAGRDELTRLRGAFHRMAGRIRRQIGQLRETDRQRREMVANISHDLRTPLTHLQGYLETLLLKEESLEPGERREYLTIAAQQSERLGSLVAKLFELAKLEALQEPVEREEFSLAELVQDVAQKFRLQAEKEGITMSAAIPPGHAAVSADLGLLERVLDNLIENAIRHTQAGGSVTLAVREDGARVQVEVSDTGRGIPADDLPRIFERFYTAPSGTVARGGAGLGLAIARRALQLHESDLLCDSAPGSGTTFRFQLPARTTAA